MITLSDFHYCPMFAGEKQNVRQRFERTLDRPEDFVPEQQGDAQRRSSPQSGQTAEGCGHTLNNNTTNNNVNNTSNNC